MLFRSTGEQFTSDVIVEVGTVKSELTLEGANGHSAHVMDVALSADGERILSASLDRTVRVWSPTTGEELFRLEHDAVVTCVTMSPVGRQILTVTSDDELSVWDVMSAT